MGRWVTAAAALDVYTKPPVDATAARAQAPGLPGGGPGASPCTHCRKLTSRLLPHDSPRRTVMVGGDPYCPRCAAEARRRSRAA